MNSGKPVPWLTCERLCDVGAGMSRALVLWRELPPRCAGRLGWALVKIGFKIK